MIEPTVIREYWAVPTYYTIGAKFETEAEARAAVVAAGGGVYDHRRVDDDGRVIRDYGFKRVRV